MGSILIGVVGPHVILRLFGKKKKESIGRKENKELLRAAERDRRDWAMKTRDRAKYKAAGIPILAALARSGCRATPRRWIYGRPRRNESLARLVNKTFICATLVPLVVVRLVYEEPRATV